MFKNGRSQALRIPREFELPGNEAVIRKDGNKLIVEPVEKEPGLLALPASWERLTRIFGKSTIRDLAPTKTPNNELIVRSRQCLP